ncbi:MAG: thioredoxin family protein [Halobacteriales archaeon]|nr:thioredoxin family protein [Halobacteriales archaeon]
MDTLPADGFDERLRTLGRVAVLFTADWCPHCRRFEPEFAAAQGLPLARADISDEEGDARWEQFGIQVVPTIIVFDDGKPVARLDGVLGRGISAPQLRMFLDAQRRAWFSRPSSLASFMERWAKSLMVRMMRMSRKHFSTSRFSFASSRNSGFQSMVQAMASIVVMPGLRGPRA